MKTKQTQLEELKARHAAEIREAEMKFAILEWVPELDDRPTISSLSETPEAYSGYGYLSFSAPAYDPQNKHSPLAIARALEAAGWKLGQCTRAKYGNYRRQMAFGPKEGIPEESSREKLVDNEPALPVWIEPQQYTNCDLNCWMIAPDGRHFRVLIDIPGKASISALRVTSNTDWMFQHGSGKVHYPDGWYTLQDKGGETFAQVRDCFCSIDTKQGISGRISWGLEAHEQGEFPLSLSQVMEAMKIG